MDTGDPLDNVAAPGWRVEIIGETVSTNQLAGLRAEAGELGWWAAVANHQLAGKGRRGNRWEAPAGSSLLLSALLRPALPLRFWPRFAVAAAVAVVRAIETTTGLSPQIKWPNDILVDGRKVAGILVESRVSDNLDGCWLVVGVGINVFTRDFPVDLRYPATSLVLANGHAPPRSVLASAVLVALREAVENLDGGGWDAVCATYRAHDALINRRIQVECHGQVVEGRADGIDMDGELVLVGGPDGKRIVLRDAYRIHLLDGEF